MKNPATHDLLKYDDENLRRNFTWLTRNGMGMRFPGTPIGWYQVHQFCAMDYIQEEAEIQGLAPDSVFVFEGYVYQNLAEETWSPQRIPRQICSFAGLPKLKAARLCMTRDVFNEADNRTRSSVGCSRWASLAQFDKRNERREFVLGKKYTSPYGLVQAVARTGHVLTFQLCILEPTPEALRMGYSEGNLIIANPEDKTDPPPYTWPEVK